MKLRDPKSIASLCLQPYAFAVPVGQGTGFVVQVEECSLLVTNYHVISGRDPRTGEQLREAKALPDRILIPLLSKRSSRELGWRAHVQWTVVDDEPLWIEHPKLGRAFDVVALPLEVPSDCWFVPYSRDEGPPLATDLGSEVMIVGFPEGVTGAGLTAIWKGGTVASEPALTITELNHFLVDSNTRKGMSGAPVFARRFGNALMDSGDHHVSTGVSDRMLGVYAGRAADAPDMTLGRVWSWQGVKEVIDEAVSRVRRGLTAPSLATIAHIPKENTAVVKLNGKLAVQLVPPPGVQVPPISKSVADLVEEMVLADQRFGVNLERVRMAAAIVAAVKAADAQSGSFQLEDSQYAILREVLSAPSGGYAPNFAVQLLPLIEHVMSAGAGPA